MGTQIQNIVDVVITRETARLTPAGFGTGLVLSSEAFGVIGTGVRTKLYANIDDVAVDFAETTRVYKACARMFTQDPTCQQIKVGAIFPSDVSLTASLNAVQIADADWYGLALTNKTKAQILLAAAWCETHIKLFFANNQDADVPTAVTTDVMSALKALLYDRTTYLFHKKSGFTFTPISIVVVDGVATITANNVNKQKVTISVKTISNNGTYTATINSVACTFTSDSTATEDEITAGLAAIINSVAGATVTATDNTNGTVTVEADAIGVPFTMTVTANLDTATEMSNEIGLAANDPIVITGATPAGLNGVQSIDSVSGNTATFLTDEADGAATGTLSIEANYYFPEVGWMSNFCKDPGSITWKFKEIVGVPADVLSTSELGYLDTKLANYYENVQGASIISSEAKVASGEYIDIIHGIDWLTAQIAEGVFTLLIDNDKVPFNEKGMGQIEAVVKAKLQLGVDKQLLNDNTCVVTVPKLSAVPSVDKAARILRNVTFSAQITGAIHKTIIRGRLVL